jgi:hypothetical protein
MEPASDLRRLTCHLMYRRMYRRLTCHLMYRRMCHLMYHLMYRRMCHLMYHQSPTLLDPKPGTRYSIRCRQWMAELM